MAKSNNKQLSLTYDQVLGADFVRKVWGTSAKDDPPLVIGERRWSKAQLASELGVVHVAAARSLTAAAKDLPGGPAKSVKDLYDRSNPYTFATRGGFGETKLLIAWRVFEVEGLDFTTWYMKGEHAALVAFRTIKHHAQKRGDFIPHEKLVLAESRKQKRKMAGGRIR